MQANLAFFYEVGFLEQMRLQRVRNDDLDKVIIFPLFGESIGFSLFFALHFRKCA